MNRLFIALLSLALFAPAALSFAQGPPGGGPPGGKGPGFGPPPWAGGGGGPGLGPPPWVKPGGGQNAGHWGSRRDRREKTFPGYGKVYGYGGQTYGPTGGLYSLGGAQGYASPPWVKPGWERGDGYRPGKGGPGHDRWVNRHHGYDNYYGYGGQTYGLVAYGPASGLYYGAAYGYRGGLDMANVRYINVAEMGVRDGGTDYRPRLFYDSLDAKNFRPVLEDLSSGVLGSLMIWPDRPGLVAHSYAVEKLFAHLDRKIKARLGDLGDLPERRLMAEAHKIVRDSLAPLVSSVSVEGGEYVVRFRMGNGKLSPWVVVPVVYGVGNPIPGRTATASRAADNLYASGYFEGFSGEGNFEPAGPFYYRGPDSGASLEPAKPDYNPANLYWKD